MLDAQPKSKNRRLVEEGRKRRKWAWYALYLAVAGLLVAGGVAIRNARPSRVSLRDQMIQVSQMFVRQSIDPAIRASFAGQEETVVEPLPGEKFLISGWVDLINERGQPDRQNFSCVVYKNANDSWVGERVTLLPQM